MRFRHAGGDHGHAPDLPVEQCRDHERPAESDPENGRHGLVRPPRQPETGKAITWSVIAARKSRGAQADLRPAGQDSPECKPEPDGEDDREREDHVRRRDVEGQGPRRAPARRPAPALEVSLERGDDSRVELRARVLAELLERLLGARSVAVAAVGGDRVVRIATRISREPKGSPLRRARGIPRAVPVLVVVLDPDVPGRMSIPSSRDAPSWGWCASCRASCGVSWPGFWSTRSGMAILPRSCKRPASFSCSTSSSSSPSWRAIDSTSRATRSECAPVYSSFASTTRMRFSAARSRAWRSTLELGRRLRLGDGCAVRAEAVLPVSFAQ